jgi:ferredoxin-type protein NapF
MPVTKAIRPPWAVSERHFVKNCTLCGACITNCPQKILHYSKDTDLALRFYPEMILDNNSCNFCKACVDSCTENALSLIEGSQQQAYAILTGICVKQYSQYCTNCFDACLAHAITETPGGININPSLCQGCGECALVCSQQAISMQKKNI